MAGAPASGRSHSSTPVAADAAAEMRHSRACRSSCRIRVAAHSSRQPVVMAQAPAVATSVRAVGSGHRVVAAAATTLSTPAPAQTAAGRRARL